MEIVKLTPAQKTAQEKAESLKAKKESQSETAKQLLAIKEENEILKKKVVLAKQRADAVDPEVIIRYKGKRKDFVFKTFDFSSGTCTMLNSEAQALIKWDPFCFEMA